MIRKVKESDINQLRLIRNKWQQLGLFRQNHNLSPKEQEKWFRETDNAGVIINDRAYGKIWDDGEVSFYGYDEWLLEDLKELLAWGNKPIYYGECYQNNQFLWLWLEAGFKVEGYLKNRKYWQGRIWDSLLLEKDNDIYT